ncbi:hypothetical protein JM946_17545 [Steroidobacter sp. S1-65]|uniref:Uncharacterized protein n=1 Tax=Steroidobacter gossypii TaxID=2805490 RepID=A0ABS1WZZ7_9GAMM|nr:hypothetical protein [Steroidobacter gossypii]MBM0106536.1 hypothetical protein [Steroidobacter gossypii]
MHLEEPLLGRVLYERAIADQTQEFRRVGKISRQIAPADLTVDVYDGARRADDRVSRDDFGRSLTQAAEILDLIYRDRYGMERRGGTLSDQPAPRLLFIDICSHSSLKPFD